MTKTKAGIGVVMALGLAAAGCNQTTTAGPVPMEQFSSRTAQAFCGLASRCASYANLPGLLLASAGGDCQAQMTAYYENSVFAPYRDAIAAGHIVYRADLAGACLDALGGATCDGLSTTPASCGQVFEGTLADGASCTLAEECGPTSTCSNVSSGCGTCTHVPQIGEACTNSCDTGAYCDATTARCVAQIASGGACNPEDNNTCADGLSCMPTAGDPQQGTCSARPIVGVGESCTDARCQDGLICAVGTNAVCRAPRTDGTCQLTFTGPGDCRVTQTCNATFGPDGTCVAIPAVGEACSGVCQAPARCGDDGTGNNVCLVPHANGESCTAPGECWSSRCTSGQCVARPLCSAS